MPWPDSAESGVLRETRSILLLKNKAESRYSTLGQVVPMFRVWGEPQQAKFIRFTVCGKSDKFANGKPIALLAGL